MEKADVPAPPLVLETAPAALAGLVSRIVCFEAHEPNEATDRELASFTVPIIFSFADPFRIAFDRAPNAGDRIGSFVSGLHPGYVDISYGGSVSCLQIDLTPIGARLFFARPMSAFATRLVSLDDVEDGGLRELRDRLGAVEARPVRLRIATDFLERRLLGQVVHPDTAYIWSAIQRSRGDVRIDRMTEHLGWSRKRLAAHARDAFGMTPKRIARIARFHHAMERAGVGARPDWAGIAAECGFADQAHLVRDFTAFAGLSPERWRGRAAATVSKQIDNPARDDHA